MYSKIRVEPINSNHTLCLLELWKKQFAFFCSDADLFIYWENNTQDILQLIRSHAETGQGKVAKIGNQIVGYLVYDSFRFHGTKSAFVPLAGNASVGKNRGVIYSIMYQELAKKWVNDDIKNHYMIIPFADNIVKDTLFDIGFGSYLIDAFSKLKPVNDIFDKNIIIEKANEKNIHELFDIVKLSRTYYRHSPIFINMEEISLDQLSELVSNSNVFVAKYHDKIIGFMNLTIADNNDVYSMCAKHFGQIDEIGAYILKEYRNRNIGNQLINEVADFCKRSQVPCVHVDFETSNLYANQFWRKYFKPTMISLKRTVHKDIQTTF